jgi:hypothetical protein
MQQHDPALDALLDLNGITFVIDPSRGFWVRFVVTPVRPAPEKPHGLDYSLTLHGPDGERLVGFDNAHPVESSGTAIRRIIATASGQFGRTSTAMQPSCFLISGRRSMRC